MKKEQIIKKCFITGIDVNPETNLIEGYVSIWKNDYNNKIMVYSVYHQDNNCFYYEVIPYQDKEDIFYNMDIVEEDFLSYIDHTRKQLLKSLDNENGRLFFLSALQRYYGEPFYSQQKANTIDEVIQSITGYDIND